MKSELSPEELAHIRTTYQTYSTHLRWLLLSVFAGVAFGAICGFVTDGVALTNPFLWVGVVWGAALPSADFSKNSTTTRELIRAPATLVKELRRRVKEVVAGHRSLKERFGQ